MVKAGIVEPTCKPPTKSFRFFTAPGLLSSLTSLTLILVTFRSSAKPAVNFQAPIVTLGVLVTAKVEAGLVGDDSIAIVKVPAEEMVIC